MKRFSMVPLFLRTVGFHAESGGVLYFFDARLLSTMLANNMWELLMPPQDGLLKRLLGLSCSRYLFPTSPRVRSRNAFSGQHSIVDLPLRRKFHADLVLERCLCFLRSDAEIISLNRIP